MTILGIETSTAVCSVGLVDDKNLALERSVVESHIHSEKLQVLIRDLLGDARIPAQELSAVAVSIGPGSFTGLRIGLSSAKGFCYALQKPLIAVPTFEGIALAASGIFHDYLGYQILIDAKQSDFYTAVYRSVGGLVETELEVTVKSMNDLVFRPGWLSITDAQEKLQRVFGKQLHLEDVHRYCRGDMVARIGLKKYAAKEFSDLSSIEPLYLKDFMVKQSAVASHG